MRRGSRSAERTGGANRSANAVPSPGARLRAGFGVSTRAGSATNVAPAALNFSKSAALRTTRWWNPPWHGCSPDGEPWPRGFVAGLCGQCSEKSVGVGCRKSLCAQWQSIWQMGASQEVNRKRTISRWNHRRIMDSVLDGSCTVAVVHVRSSVAAAMGQFENRGLNYRAPDLQQQFSIAFFASGQ